jgi:glycosyltransferase involved in cell wall biosynthesis
MMRIGKNPSKTGVPAYSPKGLGIALLVYIPVMEGYFKHSLEILKIQISSLYQNTKQDFDLLIFDNGSCYQVVNDLSDLYDQKIIDWLVLSQHNLGKVGAWNWIFGSMPNDLICYADSDVLFRQGWLETSLEIIQAFPKVGMVSAQPTFHDVLDGNGKAHLSLQENPNINLGKYHPSSEIVEEFCLGIGADDNLLSRFADVELLSITELRSNTSAVIGATHMQFIIPGEVARQMTPLPVSKGLHRDETTALDRKIDELDYLHLSSYENYVVHMGNIITDKLLSEVQAFEGTQYSRDDSEELILSKRSVLFRLFLRLLKYPRINQFLLRVYDFLYRALYAEKL